MKSEIKEIFKLGLKYYLGESIEQNYEKAFELFKKAASEGDIEAKYYLACCYEYGNGVEENYQEAIKIYEELA